MRIFSGEALDGRVRFACNLAEAVRRIALGYFRFADLTIENKDSLGFDPVTRADQEIEQFCRERIQADYPEDGILGEEFGLSEGTSGYCWVIDPIDGTRAFITGLPTWGVLIALHDGTRPLLGVMDQPFTAEQFRGLTANPETVCSEWQRGNDLKTLKIRRCAHISHAIMMTTDPRLFTGDERPVFEALESRARLSRYGTDCYAYALLAMGQVDMVIESGLSGYDIQALIPIIEGAGGMITNWEGGTCYEGGQVLAVGDPVLHQQVIKLIAQEKSRQI